MPEVTIIYAFYDNGDMLARQVQEWNCYSAEILDQLHLIIVDDASPHKHARDVLRTVGIPAFKSVSVYRVIDDIPWNQDGARNLGMLKCQTEWALMLDMDHVLPTQDAAAMLRFVEQRAQPGHYYMPLERLSDGTSMGRPHPNQYLFRREDFWAMGGYDEDFAGWYGSDGNFRKCAKGAGLREVYILDKFGTNVYRATEIADANTKLGRKDSSFYSPNNPKLNAKRRGPPYRAEGPIRFAFSKEL